MILNMKTMTTCITDRGQVSIPAEIRAQLGWVPGKRLLWEHLTNGECRVVCVASSKRKGAEAMRGYASTFRKTQRSAVWMKELRDGETP